MLGTQVASAFRAVIGPEVAVFCDEVELRSGTLLVTTSTERAAGEMRQRIEELIDQPAPAVGTFHSIALGWLREDGRSVGVPPGFRILAGADRWIFARELMWKIGDVALTGDERPDDL